MSDAPVRYPLWTRGDLDGFFGLMVDNLVQVLLIVGLCTTVAGLPPDFVYTRILPGVAVSLLVGNVFYGLQARYSARRHNNPDCTALPYGINTPSVIAYALFIMGPVYAGNRAQLGDAAAAELAWKAGLLACLVSGAIEFFGAFVAERLRRVTPRAALLGVLAAVGITFIAADFAFQLYARPLVGLLPLALLLLAYFAHYRFPLGLPGGFLAVLFGTAVAWLASVFGWDGFGGVKMSAEVVRDSLHEARWIQPQFWGHEIWAMLTDPAQRDLLLRYLTVSIPMGLLNVLGSLQNIESAEAAGDRFPTGPSLAVNGIGSVCAGLFGSCFPTAIYIGHPGWKALGARSGYSILNGLFFTALFLFGLGPFLKALVPIEAGAAIVMYIGIVITAQAFQATPREHAPAVAIALFPALAALLLVVLGNYLDVLLLETPPAKTLADLLHSTDPRVKTLPGLLTLTGANSAWLIVTVILAAIGVALIERRFGVAAVWSGVAAVLTALGLLHAYRLEGNTVRELFLWQAAAPSAHAVADRAFPVAAGYGLATLLFLGAAWISRRPAAPSAALQAREI